MFAVSSGHIWLYIPPTDMRKQFDGLVALVQGTWACGPTRAIGSCLLTNAVPK